MMINKRLHCPLLRRVKIHWLDRAYTMGLLCLPILYLCILCVTLFMDYCPRRAVGVYCGLIAIMIRYFCKLASAQDKFTQRKGCTLLREIYQKLLEFGPRIKIHMLISSEISSWQLKALTSQKRIFAQYLPQFFYAVFQLHSHFFFLFLLPLSGSWQYCFVFVLLIPMTIVLIQAVEEAFVQIVYAAWRYVGRTCRSDHKQRFTKLMVLNTSR